jgi:hypothetical protein
VADRDRFGVDQAERKHVEDHQGVPDAKLIVLVGVEGEDAKRLERISAARGKPAADVVAELLREAERTRA